MATVGTGRIGLSARRWVSALGAIAILSGLITVAQAASTPDHASAALPTGITATKIGWDVVGLDSNRVTVGPNQYPNGVRVCNTNVSGAAITGSATWTWANTTNASNIYLGDDPAGLSNSVNWSVAPGACQSVYWTVEIARQTSSYFKSRSFAISVTSGGLTESNIGVVNDQSRSIYVERIVSQNRNVVGSVTGPGIAPDTTPIYVGQEYTYTVNGATAPGGYEQLEFAAVFDPRFFEILEVTQNYAANTAPASRVPNPNYQVYADACGWNYFTRACTSTGKTGGNMTSTYRVRVIGSGSSELNTLIYDFSGSSYHYNADFGFGPTLTTATKALSVTKTSNVSTYSGSGNTINFTISFTNTGTSNITNLTVDDTTTRTAYAATGTRLASSACSPSLSGLSLAPNDSVTCTYAYTTTANDVSAGTFTNTATVTGTTTGGTVSEQGSVSLLYQQTATKITVTKTATPTQFTSDDTRIYYTITVKSDNNGNGNVTISDPLIDAWTTAGCPGPTNAGGGVLTSTGYVCTGYHIITAADRTRGYVTNTATALVNQNGKDSVGIGSVTIPSAGLSASLSLTKAASSPTFGDDSTLTYTFVVSNTGDDTITGITIDDTQLNAPATCAKTTLIGGLSPDDTTTCTGLKTFTQSEVDAGSATNYATVKGFNSRGVPITASATATVNGPTRTPALSITKSASADSFSGAGDIVPFSFAVQNTGNVTVNNITVTDDTIDSRPGITCQSRSLLPGASTTCVGRYTATATDEIRGSITNVASVSGTSTGGNPSATSNVISVPYTFSEITVTKVSRDDTVAGAGSSATFDIRVINTGNTRLNNVTVDDTIFRSLGLDTTVPVSCSMPLPLSPLNVDDSFTCVANYTFTQADVDRGFVSNTVLATGDDTSAPPQGFDDSAVAQVLGPVRSPGLKIEKVAITDSFYNIGDKIQYRYTLTNTGNVTLTNVAVDDSMVTPQPIPCVSDDTLAPGQSTVCEAYYMVQASDLSKQWLENTATATGTPPSGTILPPVTPSSAYVPKVAPPPLQVTKTVNDDTFSTVGELQDYTVVVRNTSGSDTIYDLTIDDPLFPDTTPPISPFGALNCGTDDTTLSPNEIMTCTATYAITQEDLNRGYVNNTATAIGLRANGQVLIDRASVTITGPTNVTTGITVTKSTTATQYSTVGQLIPFNFLVKNTGAVTLTHVTVLDGTLTSGPVCPTPATLNPDDTFICTGTYEVTANDLSLGRVVNVATATGTPTRGSQPTAAPSTAIVPRAGVTPAMTVDKTQTVSTYTGSGQTLTYSIVVTNTGDDTLNSVALDDTVTRTNGSATAGTLGSCSPVTLPGTLNPGQSTTCSAAYVTTAGESSAGGSVTNTATARATPASGGGLTRDDSVTATYTSPGPGPGPGPTPTASINVTKTASPTTFSRAGDQVTYTVTATNTGQSALGNVTVNDPKVTLNCSPTTPASLAIGASVICTGTYTITQADVQAGRVDNTATASGTPPGGSPVSGSGTARVTGNPSSRLTVTKSASPSTFTKAGDRITYTVTATNSGDVPLTGVIVTDPKVTLTCSPSTPATLAPGARVTCTGTYTITQADVDSGSVSNTGTARGTDPDGKEITDSDTKRITTPSEGKLSLTKTASPAKFAKVGDRITYTVAATNSGEVTLTGVTVSDPKLTLTCSRSTPATLAPGARITCTGNYTVTQDDVDAGYVDNSASARGSDPSGRPTETTAHKTVPGTPTPGVEVVKTSSPTTFTEVGDTLRFTVVATNTGTSTLTGVTVTDPKATLTCSPSTPARLAPGAKVTCTGTYVTTQDDVDEGKVTNTATASGRDPSGKDITGRGGTEVPGPVSRPSLHVSKSSAPTTFAAVGDRISFSVIATNNGNVTLTGVTVTDPLATLGCAPTTPATLAPGASLTCTGTYRVTQADMDRGAVTNTARGRGEDPGGNRVTGTGSTQVPGLAANPRMTMTKSASVSTATEVGQPVTYTFTVTNTGNTTIRGIAVSDPLLTAAPTCRDTSLAPGASTTCAGSYAVTKADLQRGSIVNVATATATPARGTLAPVTATVTIRAEEAWIKAQETKRATSQGTRLTVENITESPNLGQRRVTVTCTPTGVSVRGDFSYCRWRDTPNGVVVETVGLPVKVVITITARLTDDPSTKVTKRIVMRTKN